jgi:alkylhydroperoxidase family enzyme
MKEIQFANTRFDPDLTPFHDTAKAMAQQFGYSAELSVDRRLAQLLRLRVAQLNPCSYCLILHNEVADNIDIPRAVTAHLPSWRESDLFTPAEQAALAYCEALTSYDVSAFGPCHDQLALHFPEQQVAEIAAVVINMNVWTRLKLAQGAQPSHPSE